MKKESQGVKTARSGIIYVVGQVAASLAVLATLAILAHPSFLNPTNFGLYSIIIAFYTFFGSLGNFAIGAAIRKKIAEGKSEDEKRKLIVNGYALAFAISVIVAIVGVLISGYAAVYIYHQPSIIRPLMLVSGLVVLWAIMNMTLATLVAIGLVKEATFIDIVYAITQLVIAVVLVYLGYGITGAIAGLAIGTVAGTVLGLYYVVRKIGMPKLHLDIDEMKDILGFATPVYASYLVLQGLYSFGILFLGGYVSAAVVGNYNIGYELGGFVSIIITSNTFILLPAFSSIASAKKAKNRITSGLNNSIYYTLLFLAPIVAYVASVSRPLVYILFSNVHPFSPLYLSIVAIGLTMGIIWNYSSTLMLGIGDLKRFMKYQIISAIVELALLFVLTPRFHVLGLLAGTFIIFPILMDILYIYALKRSVSFKPNLRKPAIVSAVAVILFVIMYAVSVLLSFSYVLILINIVVALVVFPPLVTMAGGIKKIDIAFLKKTLGKRSVSKPLLSVVNYAEQFIR